MKNNIGGRCLTYRLKCKFELFVLKFEKVQYQAQRKQKIYNKNTLYREVFIKAIQLEKKLRHYFL